MNVSEILDQARKLSPEEREELLEQLRLMQASPDAETETELRPGTGSWGANLVRLLEESDPIELVHPEIEDPVEWVRQLRLDSRRRRLDDWGET